MEIDDNKLAERIRSEVFLPALRHAAKNAEKLKGSPNDILNGSMMAIGDMLQTLIGTAGAVLLLNGLAEHLKESALIKISD